MNKPKRIFLNFLFFLTFYPSLIFTEEHWQIIREPKWDCNFCSICFVDSQNGWAIGDNKNIIYTGDGGKTWDYQNNEAVEWGADYKDIIFVNKNYGWLVGFTERGIIFRTEDGGDTWVAQETLINPWPIQVWESVHFVNELAGWIVGWSGSPKTRYWGTILHTIDGGNTWEVQEDSLDSFLYDVTFVDSLRGWTCGQYGDVFCTVDGGKQWNIQDTGINDDLLCITFFD
jgi:photosystem II stability/assembly factor-like uncharacterized protein